MFELQDEGTIWLVRPLTDDVREWLLENTDGSWFGNALVVEHRFVEPLVLGLVAEGFTAQ